MGIFSRISKYLYKSDLPKPAETYSDGQMFGNYMISSSGQQITPRTAINFTTVYACVSFIAKTVASFEAVTYQRLPNGGKIRNIDNPIWRCFNVSPDGEMDVFKWREACIAHLLQWGNCYNEIELAPDGTVNLWIIPPAKVEPQRASDGTISYKVDGTKQQIPGWKMLHWSLLGDGLQGFSPIKLNKNAIGLALSMEEFGAKFFANGCTTTGVITHPGQLSEPAQHNLQKKLHDGHSGDNAQKIMIFQEGITFTPTSIPPEDSQLLASRVYQTQELCRIYGLDPSLIGEHSNSTWNNVEQQNINFVVHCIRPMCKRLESQINQKLFGNQTEYFLEFRIDDLLRGDIQARYTAYNVGKLGGWLTTNEIREWENLNPVDGGDVLLTPLNMAPAGLAPSGDTDGTDDPSGSGISPKPVGTPPDVPIDDTVSPDEITVSSLNVVKDNLDRMIRREIEAIKAAAAKPESFLTAVDLFYGKHEAITDRAIKPSVELYSQITKRPAENIAKLLCDTGKNEILEVAGSATASNLVELINKWAETRLNKSTHIIEGMKNGNSGHF